MFIFLTLCYSLNGATHCTALKDASGTVMLYQTLQDCDTAGEWANKHYGGKLTDEGEYLGYSCFKYNFVGKVS